MEKNHNLLSFYSSLLATLVPIIFHHLGFSFKKVPGLPPCPVLAFPIVLLRSHTYLGLGFSSSHDSQHGERKKEIRSDRMVLPAIGTIRLGTSTQPAQTHSTIQKPVNFHGL